MLGFRLSERRARALGALVVAGLGAGCASGAPAAPSPESSRARSIQVYTCLDDFRFAVRPAGNGVALALG